MSHMLRFLMAGSFILMPLACTSELNPERCPEGTVRQANQCVPPTTLAVAPPVVIVDAGPVSSADAGVSDAGTMTESDAGSVNVDGLPFFIEESFSMTGFFSENLAADIARSDCTGVSGTAPGATCLQIDFDPQGDAWGGYFFQNPADNWGQMPGLDVPAGAQQIRFRAWGATGSEAVIFGAGIDNEEPNEDGWHVETNPITLGTDPATYFIDIRNIDYGPVVGGFMWVAQTPDRTTPVRFFIDNIEWTADPPGGSGVALPFWVDAHFAMSGFFPGPPAEVSVAEDCTASGTDPESVCRRITVTPNGSTFAGFYFQNPEGNWGAQPGIEVAPGAQLIRFRAWGAAGGEMLKFGAGIDNEEPNDDGWNIENPAVALGTEPAEYTVSLVGINYQRVVGGFLWVIELPEGSPPQTFFLDNVRWE